MSLLLLLQVRVYLRLPSSDESSVDFTIVISFSYFLVMEMLGALEDKPIESSILPHLDLSLVRSALTLMDSAHVTAEALAILEVLSALGTSMSIIVFWLEDKRLAFLYFFRKAI